jgi:hypothetical protein
MFVHVTTKSPLTLSLPLLLSPAPAPLTLSLPLLLSPAPAPLTLSLPLLLSPAPAPAPLTQRPPKRALPFALAGHYETAASTRAKIHLTHGGARKRKGEPRVL